MTPTGDRMIGTRLGNFKITELIGHGGMGEVYRARQVSLNRMVAVKVLPAAAIRDDNATERFTREAHAMAQLSHPNIVDVIEVGEQDDMHYFAMHLVDGPSIASMIDRQGPLSAQRSAEIAAQVAEALQHAHERGVVHRDIKPGNILMCLDGRAIVTDFGIAKAVEGALGGGQSLTQGSIGTPEYMSPEVIRGNPVDGRTDIYSLGIVLYQMLTGRVPFHATTPFEMANRHLTDPPTPPSTLGAACPQWLETILLRALAKEPAQRFASAGEMAGALRQHSIVSLPDAAPPPTGPLPPPNPEPVPGTTSASNELMLDLDSLGESRTYFGIELPGYVWALAAVGAALVAIAILWLIGHSLLVALSVAPAVVGAPVQDPPGATMRPPPPDPEPAPQAPSPEPPLSEVVVQDVGGLTFTQASDLLNSDDLSVLRARTRFDDRVAEGVVLEQTPVPGEKVEAGTRVALTISLGPKPAPPLPELEMFTNAERGYRLKKPVGWSVEYSSYGDPGAKYCDVNFRYPDNHVKVMAETGPAATSSDPLDSWRSMDQRFRRKYGSDYSCIDLRHTTLGGHRAGYWEFVLMRNGKRYRNIDVGTNVGDRGFAVLCQAPSVDFEQYRELFESIVDSFEIL